MNAPQLASQSQEARAGTGRPSDAAGLPEPVPTWYERQNWGFGDIRLHVIASGLYLIVALAPLVSYVYCEYSLPSLAKECPTLLLLWTGFVALGYPIWSWCESSAFERWVRAKSEAERKAERAYFTLHAGLAKNFWTAVLAIYTVAGLIGIALKNG